MESVLYIDKVYFGVVEKYQRIKNRSSAGALNVHGPKLQQKGWRGGSVAYGYVFGYLELARR